LYTADSLKNESQRLLSDSIYHLPLNSLVPIPIVVGENFVIRQRELKPTEESSDQISNTNGISFESSNERSSITVRDDEEPTNMINIPSDTVDSQRLAFLEEVAAKTISEFCNIREYSRTDNIVKENILSALSEPQRIQIEHDY
jgi:hypothetical protein